MSCRSVERQFLDVVRRTASDAVRLEVEAHLQDCASCRETRAAFGLLGALRAQPAPRLGAPAERRIVDRLVSSGARGAVRVPLARRRVDRVVFAGVVVAAIGAIGLAVALRVRRPELGGGPTLPAVVEGQTLDATQPGMIAFAGAGVTYDRGTALTFHPATRTIAMARGEVDVDVVEHRTRRFRVTTPHFVVEVVGTRFVVTPAGVRTLRGHVRVLDLAGRELADVPAGSSWSAPPVPAPSIAPAPAALPERARAAPAAPVVAGAVTGRADHRRGGARIARARGARGGRRGSSPSIHRSRARWAARGRRAAGHRAARRRRAARRAAAR